MRSLLFFVFTLSLTVAVLATGCVNTSSKGEDKRVAEKTAAPETAPPGDAEAEVKAVPEPAPPAAAPPADLTLDTTPPAGPARPASPEEQTKKALEPVPVQAAALPQPKSEPVEPVPAPENASQAKPEGKPTRPAGEKTEASPQAEPRQDAAKKGKKDAREATPREKTAAVAVVGDSLAVGVGMTMSQRLEKTGLGCEPLGKVSTGLINKKFFDWEKKLTELVAKEKLSAVVVVMGGNDANNAIGGRQPGTPQWSEAYREKAESFLRIAAGAGVKVIWVGLPAMREAAYNARVVSVNAAAKDACAKVGGCTYMEASTLFTDASGNYVQAKDIGGRKVPLRAKDGVHMTMTGYDLLCGQVLDKLGSAGALPSGN
ncbi:DUF459 domain-containing protein [Solidesulfovibrio sp.]|uniref:SGNH/GDSL hydrolase family protein n=1 Tax=Solidesulfovibrio sp. TaxID=2910990 RepID=UPI00260CC4F3|nr:DUF459 domain-containing protein [Solidesulfovibrio sp.]